MVIASVDYFQIIFLPWDCNRLYVLFHIFKNTIYSENRALRVSLEEVINFSVDFLELVHSETENVTSWEFRGLKNESHSILAFSDLDAL